MWAFLGATLITFIAACSAAKILIAIPTPSISHQRPVHILAKALLERGHRITFMTTDSAKIKHENYTEIDISVGYRFLRENFDFTKMHEEPPTESVKILRDISRGSTDMQLSEPAVKEFIRSREQFDLVVVERLGYMGFYGLIPTAGSPPAVGIVTHAAPSPVYYSHGNPVNPAHMPDVWLGFPQHMGFWQRLYSAYFYLRFMYMWFFQVVPIHDAIMRKHFGPDVPPLAEIDRNFSLLIINDHFSMEYPRPYLPNIIEITGVHVATEQKALPKDVKAFLDGAESGVIYFSLGSNVLSKGMPDWKRQAFIDAFRELPQRVLWKWEDDSMPNQPSNLMTRKWLPQQDILAHPSVWLFITQGGLQSFNEATYHAVPLLVIPFFADQPHIAAKVATSEIGARLEFRDVSKDSLLESIRKVLHDRKYKENMERFSAVFREHQATSLDTAVWWLEYVVRHRGAPHLRSAALDLHWWQLLLLDVIGFVLLVAAAVLVAVFVIVRHVVRITRKRGQKEKRQ